MRKDDENAKDRRWNVPVDLPHVKPEDYNTNDANAVAVDKNQVGSIKPKLKKNGQ